MSSFLNLLSRKGMAYLKNSTITTLKMQDVVA